METIRSSAILCPKIKCPHPPLYEAKKKESEKSAAIKADRSILQRIITAYDAGRRVDLPRILSQELMEVPLVIVDTNSQKNIITVATLYPGFGNFSPPPCTKSEQ